MPMAMLISSPGEKTIDMTYLLGSLRWPGG
jgi:hypothetical protein